MASSAAYSASAASVDSPSSLLIFLSILAAFGEIALATSTPGTAIWSGGVRPCRSGSAMRPQSAFMRPSARAAFFWLFAERAAVYRSICFL